MNHAIRIFDRNERDSSKLVHLEDLIKYIIQVRPTVLNSQWLAFDRVCGKKKIYGYGEHVCHLEVELDKGKCVAIAIEECCNWLESGELFYDVHLYCDAYCIELGIFDSTFLFVSSNDHELIEAIRSVYFSVDDFYDFTPAHKPIDRNHLY